MTADQFILLFPWLVINAMLAAALLALSRPTTAADLKEADLLFKPQRDTIARALLSYAHARTQEREGKPKQKRSSSDKGAAS